MVIMPTVRTIADFRSNYNEIFELCHQNTEPVFVTRNGIEDLAVMSMETYHLLSGKLQLYACIEEGLRQVKQGKITPMKETVKSIRTKLETQCIS